MENIKSIFKEKVKFIKNANISELDKQILLNEYYNMYKNLIYVEKDKTILIVNSNKNSLYELVKKNNIKKI